MVIHEERKSIITVLLAGSNVMLYGGSVGSAVNVLTAISSVAAPGPTSFIATTQILYSVYTFNETMLYSKCFVSTLCSIDVLV